MLDSDECDRARLARDPAYDGRFYTGSARPVSIAGRSARCGPHSPERAVLSVRCRRGIGRLPAVPPLPPRSGAIFSGVERLTHDGGTRTAFDFTRGPGWQRRIGEHTVRQARGRRAASRATVHETLGRKSEPGRQDRARATGEAPAGYVVSADLAGRAGRGFRQPAPVQCGIHRGLWSAADGSASQATESVASAGAWHCCEAWGDQAISGPKRMAMQETAPSEILDALRRMALLQTGVDPSGVRLTGGVSSDIWRIDLPSGPICVKRALAKLRVAADWHAPVERNRYEARWMRYANAAMPGAAPTLLGIDEAERGSGNAVPSARRVSIVEDATARWRRRSGVHRPGRNQPREDPCRDAAGSRLRRNSRLTASSTTSAWSRTWWRPDVRIPTSQVG